MKLQCGLAVLLLFSAACGSSTPAGEEGFALAEGLADEHRVELPAAEVWAAAQAVMGEDGAVIELRRATSDGGEITAHRVEGCRVQTTVTAVESFATRVVVAVSPPNSALASMIQGRIAERLSLRKAQAELFGETSVETVYDRPLDVCVAAAQDTSQALGLEIVRRMTLDNRVRIETRDRQTRAIRFSLRRIGEGDGETAVMFTVERAQPDTLDRLRREFERRLEPEGN